MLSFPTGGGFDSTAISLERNAHIRDARLVMEGGTVETPTLYHLNATTWGAGEANAWSGSLPYGTPDQPPATYEATPFNATRVANVSAKDGALEKSPTATNFSYELYEVRVLALDLVELRILWSGYSLPPAMPMNWNGKLFLYNTTDLAWDDVAAYPFPLTGVQDVRFNATSPANYIDPTTGRASIMIASESTATEMFTDFIEVTAVSGVYPRPAVDVGGEGGIDWRWDAPGWGAVGRQTEFEDGQEVKVEDFPAGGGSLTERVLLPEGAVVTDASLIARGQPAYGSANSSAGPRVVNGSGAAPIVINALPMNANGGNSRVTLRNLISMDALTQQDTAPLAGQFWVGSDPNGYKKAAMTLNVSTTGEVSRIRIFVYEISGNPGPIRLSLEGINATGIPDGVPIAQTQVPQTAVANLTWVDFTFTGLTLQQGTSISIVLSAPNAPPDTVSNFIKVGSSANDSFVGGEALSYINLTGVGEAWSRPSGSDLMFEIRQNLTTNSLEAASLRVDSSSGSFTQSGNNSSLSFALPSITITNGTYSFTVTNANALAIRFNWSARVDYFQTASNVTISIANGTVGLWNLGNLPTGVEIRFGPALASSIGSLPAGPPGPGGERFIALDLAVNSSSQGQVVISSIDIRYTLGLATSDLSTAFDTYLWTTPPNVSRADVPLRIYSPGASTLTILEAAITYDRPPVYFDFPSTVTDEDTPLTTDLNTVFHDDWDNAALSFYVNQTSGFENASFLVSGYNLTVNPIANRSGNFVLTVTATDSRGLSTDSDPVLFTIRPFNDPPRLTVDRINVSWGHIETIDLSPFIVDAEFPTLAVTITSASGTTVSVNERSLIFDFAVGAGDVPMLITLSDGTLSATYPLLVHPRPANTPPALLPLPTVVIPSNAAWWLDLAPFAIDGEDNLSALQFSLAVPAADQDSLFWMVERTAASTFLKLIPRAGLIANITTQLTVTDTDGNANTTSLGVRITPPADIPPRIVGIDPIIALGADSTTIFLATKYSDPEDASDPSRVSWAVVNDNPDLFTAEVDAATQRLVLTPVPGASGSGSFSLILRDSAGLETSKTFTVTMPTPYRSSSASVLAVGLFFAGVVVFAAVAARRAQAKGRPRKDARLESMKREGATDEVPLLVVEGATGEDRMEIPAPAGPENTGPFLRGLVNAPGDKPPGPDEGVVSLGLKSGLEGASSPLAAPLAPGPLGAKPHARLAELYLFSLKDGGLLFEVPAKGLPQLSQADESEFLQWSFDTVRKEEKAAEAVKVLEWKGVQVVLARGESFYIAGRTRGEGFDELKSRVRTLIEEVDHNFPGSTADWQRNDVVETVGDILRRLVR
ncbi:MAG TPA: hypothetical protein VJ547_11255 [Candidatus Thermoplasmatota archaeon]|nr:hypothetical protein [Candidatus Thermoplasmatota archaeon]